MTVREFAAEIFNDHFTNKIDHLKSGWGHNFNHEFKDRKDNTYTAIFLVLNYWKPTDEQLKVLVNWLRLPLISFQYPPSSIGCHLIYNLYYSFDEAKSEYIIKARSKSTQMFSLLRSIEINGQIEFLTADQKSRLLDITKFIKSKND